MSRVLGRHIEQDSDLTRERRRRHVGWGIVLGVVICILCDLLGLPFTTEVFQGWLATCLPYGVTFYVNQGENLRRSWLWKAVLVSLPAHASYLFAIFWSDGTFPGMLPKAVVFVPVLAVFSAVESIYFLDRVVRCFKPRDGS